MKKQKVFIIGSNKTGTTSLTEAFKILGYKVCPEHIIYEFNSQYLIESSKENYNPLFDLVHKYDVFEDRPWNHTNFYEVLNEKFENSKFILTIRETENWINSYLRWSDKIALRQQWFYPIVSKVCYGNDDFLSDVGNMKSKFESRNKEIIDYFKNNSNFLIMNLEENHGWQELCNFLNEEIPQIKFPNLNKTK